MTRRKWKLTRAATGGEPEIEEWGSGGDDLRLGYSLMRALAEDDARLIEIAPGVWHYSKLADLTEPGPPDAA